MMFLKAFLLECHVYVKTLCCSYLYVLHLIGQNSIIQKAVCQISWTKRPSDLDSDKSIKYPGTL